MLKNIKVSKAITEVRKSIIHTLCWSLKYLKKKYKNFHIKIKTDEGSTILFLLESVQEKGIFRSVKQSYMERSYQIVESIIFDITKTSYFKNKCFPNNMKCYEATYEVTFCTICFCFPMKIYVRCVKVCAKIDNRKCLTTKRYK